MDLHDVGQDTAAGMYDVELVANGSAGGWMTMPAAQLVGCSAILLCFPVLQEAACRQHALCVVLDTLDKNMLQTTADDSPHPCAPGP